MNHVEILKRAFSITWRYRPLWLIGFFLALCSGGGGGGGNFNVPGGGNMSGGGGGDFENIPGLTNIDPGLVLFVVVALLCLVLFLTVVGVVVRAVTRTALIGMVRQITHTESVTLADGWRWGWSSGAWRLFLVGLVIGIPLAILSIVLILLAFSPLLLLLTEETGFIVMGILLTVGAVLLVLLLLTVVTAVVTPLQELAWRRVVLAEAGVLASLSQIVTMIKRHFKDVVLILLLMIGVAIGWGLVALLVVLPIGLVAALVVGGIPAGLVYAISGSWLGAAIAGLPLGLLVLLLVTSFATGLYLVFRSTVWTLVYLELAAADEAISPETPAEPAAPPSTSAEPEPQTSGA